MTEQRRPGRPKGSGKAEDYEYLASIADILIQNPTLRLRGAMRQFVQTRKWDRSDATLFRRWERKWESLGPDLLNAASKKAAEMRAKKANRADRPDINREMLKLLLRHQRTVNELTKGRDLQAFLNEMRAAEARMRSDPVQQVIRQMREFHDSEAMKIALRLSR